MFELRAFSVQAPPGWRRQRIEEALEEQSLPIRMQDSKEYRLVSLRRRYGGMFERERLRGKQILTKKQFALLPGAFILARMQIVHGACSNVPPEFSDGIVSQSYSQFYARSGVHMPWFVWLAKTPEMRKTFLDASQGVVVEKMTFDQGAWLQSKIPVPPLPEQRRIAEILDTLDEAIRKTEQVIAKLQQMKQGLLHDLLTRGIDENGELRDPERHPEQFKDSPLGRIPKEWEVERLGETAEITKLAGFEFTNVIRYIPDGDVIAIRPMNIKRGNLVLEDVQRISWRVSQSLPRSKVRSGDVLLTYIGAYIGESILIEDDDRFHLAPNICRVTAQRGLSPSWLLWSLRHDRLVRQIAAVTSTTATPSMNMGSIRTFKIAVPNNRAEQEICAERLSDLEQRLAGEKRAVEKLRTLKQGLMDDLLTGRVRVNVDEAAE